MFLVKIHAKNSFYSLCYLKFHNSLLVAMFPASRLLVLKKKYGISVMRGRKV